MVDLVPSDVIEQHVGAVRHPTMHLGRAVSDEDTVYVLHSAACVAEYEDLRDCPYSHALDRGLEEWAWRDAQDKPMVLGIHNGRLRPAWLVTADVYRDTTTTDP